MPRQYMGQGVSYPLGIELVWPCEAQPSLAGIGQEIVK